MFSAAIKRTLSVLVAAVRRTDESLRRNLVAAGENLSAHKAVLIYGLVWTLIAFGYEMAQFTQSIDDELFAYDKKLWPFWTGQGRFSAYYVLGILFNNMSVPFFPLFFSELCMLGAYYLIFMREKEESDAVHYFGIPLFLAAPILYHCYMFTCLTAVLGFGFLCSAICVRLFETQKPILILLGLPVGAIAVGCYQIFFPFIAMLLVFHLMKKLEEEKLKKFLLACVFHGIYLVFVYFSYSLILKWIFAAEKIKKSSYITQMINPIPDSMETFRKNIGKIFERIWFVVSGDESVYSEPIHCMSILLGLSVLLFCASVFHRFWKQGKIRTLWKSTCIVFLIAVLFLLPSFFCFLNLNRGTAAFRTFAPFSILPPAFLVFAWNKCGWRCRSILGVLAICVIGQFLYVNSKKFYEEYLNEQRDKRLVADILREILPDARRMSNKQIPFCVIGEYKPQENPQHFLSGKRKGGAFTDGSFWRIYRYLQQMLIFDFTPMNVKDFPKIENEIANMPSYPAKGSIRYVNGIAVIKLGSELRSDQRRIYRPYSKRLQFFLSSRHDHGIEKIPDGSSNIEETIWTLSKANANVSMRCVRKADFGADGTLKLLVHGNDPILTLKNLPKSQDASSSLCLSLKFTANAQEKLQVFFKRRKSPDSKEFVLGHFVVPMLKGDNLVQVAFPKEILDGGLLRIDPGSGKATEVLFEEIAIKNMKQKQ